jgi:alpha-tubulin suppressor-like RCC1 family protein
MPYSLLGKLGHGNESNLSVPTLVKHFEGVTITHMSAGCEHSAAIDSSGKLYTWGHGEGGRLGKGDNQSDSVPKEVAVLQHLGLRYRDLHVI